MKCLLRLFPESWRQRYGPEFAALLEDLPPSPAVVGDLLLLAMRTQVSAVVAALAGPRQRIARGTSASSRTAVGLVAVGGSLWATTFALGALVGWGSTVEGLAFTLLIAAAICLCVGQLLGFDPGEGGSRAPASLGRALTLVGSAVLIVALVSAIVLDYPLGIRLGWSPPEFWQAGMFLTVAGSALVAVAAIRADCISRRIGGALLVAAVVLALELVPGIDPTDEGVDGGFLQLLRYDENWFSTHPMPLIAGLIFGLAWLSIALANRRPRVLREGAVRGGTGRRRPR